MPKSTHQFFARGEAAPIFPNEDRRRAAALLDQALADYRRLGMPLDVQECLSRREILGA